MDKFTRRSTDGSVDVQASAQAYTQALSTWVAANETDQAAIGSAVEAVLDRFPGQRLPMPALLSAAVVELGASPEQHKALTARCHAYVKGQTTAGNLFITRGAGGGVSREAPVKKEA